jgi:hypothetical protein
MGEISKWLTHDDQKQLFEALVAGTLNIVFLLLIALLLWPLGRLTLALRLAKGFVILWIVVCVIAGLLNLLQRFLRVNIYDRANAYVISNLTVSCLLQAGWSAFAALAVQGFTGGASNWIALVLYLIGGVSCLTAFIVVSAFYQGQIYKLISLPLALITYIVFSVWPAVGRAVFGWFFELF